MKSRTGAKRRTGRETLKALLAEAGLKDAIAAVEPLNKDEDGTHSRVRLESGSTCIFRLYANTTRMADFYRVKEARLYTSLAAADLPVPRVLAMIAGDGKPGGDPPAMLLTDAGGTPLEHLFLSVPRSRRSTLWSAVGAGLRRLHDTDISFAGALSAPHRQPPSGWFIAELTKVLRRLKQSAPSAARSVDELLALRPSLRSYLDARPSSIRHGEGWYLPEMLLEPSQEGWRCVAWLGWGYYASVGDPWLDVVAAELIHREWTGTRSRLPSTRPMGSARIPYASSLIGPTSNCGGRGPTSAASVHG